MASDWAQSALSWWAEAGVDTLVGEEPRDWLNPTPQAPARATAATATMATMATMAAREEDTPPATLDAFRAWFVDPANLPLGAPAAPRLGPSGDPASGLMLLIDMPGEGDAEAGTLIAGEAGALLDKMLAAIGRSRDSIYLAALSPLRTPSGALDAPMAARLTAIARHHIGLLAPRALLLFGDACAKALTGTAVAGARGRWHDLETPAGAVKTLVTIRPEKLILMPGLKAHAWADLKLLMEGLTP
jgi:uracil-DNA glycosylase family 4